MSPVAESAGPCLQASLGPLLTPLARPASPSAFSSFPAHASTALGQGPHAQGSQAVAPAQQLPGSHPQLPLSAGHSQRLQGHLATALQQDPSEAPTRAAAACTLACLCGAASKEVVEQAVQCLQSIARYTAGRGNKHVTGKAGTE